MRFHRPPTGLGLAPEARAAIRSMREVASRLDIFENVRPHSDPEIRSLLQDQADNEAYAMADPGRAVAVYFTNGGSVLLDLSAFGEVAVNVQWLDFKHSRWSEESRVVTGGQPARLEAPGSGKWVALLSKK